MATVIQPSPIANVNERPHPQAVFTRRGEVVFSSAIFASMGLSQSFLSVFGIAMVPIAQEFGWSRTLVSGVMSFTFLKSLTLAVAIGWLLDRFGSRKVMLGALGLYSGAMFLFAMAPATVFGFYALFALVCCIGAAMGNTTFNKALAGWFDTSRGAAMGLAAGVGTGGGSALFPILAGTLLVSYGWRGMFVGIALVIAGTGLPIAYFMFHDPSAPAAPLRGEAVRAAEIGATLGEAMRSRTFWTMGASIAVCAGCMTAMFSQLAPIAQAQGFTLAQAVAAMTTLATVCAVAQWMNGALLDRFPRPLIMVPFYLLGTIGLWLMHHSAGMPMLLASAALMGISIGAEYSAMPLLISRYFGVAHFGKITCILYGIVALITGLVPVGMNAVFDASGSYAPALTVMEIALVGAALLILLLPSYRDVASSQTA